MWVGCIFLSPTWRDRGLGGGPDWAAGREGGKRIFQKEITCTVVRLEVLLVAPPTIFQHNNFTVLPLGDYFTLL